MTTLRRIMQLSAQEATGGGPAEGGAEPESPSQSGSGSGSGSEAEGEAEAESHSPSRAASPRSEAGSSPTSAAGESSAGAEVEASGQKRKEKDWSAVAAESKRRNVEQSHAHTGDGDQGQGTGQQDTQDITGSMTPGARFTGEPTVVHSKEDLLRKLGAKTVMERPGKRAAAAIAEQRLGGAEAAAEELARGSRGLWMRCTRCGKWRHLPDEARGTMLPAQWLCEHNVWDMAHSECSAPEENRTKPAGRSRALPSPRGGTEPESSSKRGRGGRGRSQKHGGRGRGAGVGSGRWGRGGKGSARAEGASPRDREAGSDEDSGGRSDAGDDTGDSHESSPEDDDEEEEVTKHEWVMCESCQKWRKLPTFIKAASLPEQWFCRMSDWDPERATCDAPQEPEDEEDVDEDEEEDEGDMGNVGVKDGDDDVGMGDAAREKHGGARKRAADSATPRGARKPEGRGEPAEDGAGAGAGGNSEDGNEQEDLQDDDDESDGTDVDESKVASARAGGKGGGTTRASAKPSPRPRPSAGPKRAQSPPADSPRGLDAGKGASSAPSSGTPRAREQVPSGGRAHTQVSSRQSASLEGQTEGGKPGRRAQTRGQADDDEYVQPRVSHNLNELQHLYQIGADYPRVAVPANYRELIDMHYKHFKSWNAAATLACNARYLGSSQYIPSFRRQFSGRGGPRGGAAGAEAAAIEAQSKLAIFPELASKNPGGAGSAGADGQDGGDMDVDDSEADSSLFRRVCAAMLQEAGMADTSSSAGRSIGLEMPSSPRARAPLKLRKPWKS